jgi:hypothetical protein
MTNSYKRQTERKPTAIQRFQDDLIVKDMIKPKNLERHMMLSPKKQMIDIS